MTLYEPTARPVLDGARSRLVVTLVAVVLGTGLVIASTGPGIPLESPAVSHAAVPGR